MSDKDWSDRLKNVGWFFVLCAASMMLVLECKIPEHINQWVSILPWK